MLSQAQFFTPHGFHSSCEIINLLPSQLLSEMISSIIEQSPQTGSSFYKLYTKHQDASSDLSTHHFDSALNTIQHIHQTLSKSNYDGDALQTFLKSKTSISKEAIDIFVSLYTTQTQSKNTAIATALSQGRLIGLSWKLGFAVSSDSCDNLSSPFITVMFKVADVDGVKNYPVEMTISQFKSFKASIEELKESFQDAS